MRSTLPFGDLESYVSARGLKLRAVGASGSALKEMRESGEVPWVVADRIACRQFGVHPSMIWGGWCDDEESGGMVEQLTLSGV